MLIDDDTNALPLEDVKQDDYSIEQFKIVTADLLRRCEANAYDIIILDYNGVAPASISPNDGFGVFERIRKANPNQYIIAVSAQTYDISKTAYFKEANDWLKKPTDLTTTKDKIDTGIRYLFDKSLVMQRLQTALSQEGFDRRTIATIQNRVRATNFSDLDQLSEMVKRVANVSRISDSILGILRNIAKLTAS